MHRHLQNRVLDAMSPRTREAYLYTRNLELSPPQNPNRAPSPTNTAPSSTTSSPPAASSSPASIPPATAAPSPASATSARVELLVDSAASPPSKPSRSAPSTAPPTWANSPHRHHRRRQKRRPRRRQRRPRHNINDIEKVEIVFKDGVGYDSAKTPRLHQRPLRPVLTRHSIQLEESPTRKPQPTPETSCRPSSRALCVQPSGGITVFCCCVAAAVAFPVVVPERDLLLAFCVCP